MERQRVEVRAERRRVLEELLREHREVGERLVGEPAEDATELGLEIGIVGQPAPVVRAVVRRTAGPERDATADELAEPCRDVGRIRPHAEAVGKDDLRGRDAVGGRLLDVSRGRQQQYRKLLRAADLTRRLVRDRPAAVAGDTEVPEVTRPELLAAHRLHWVPPDLDDAAEAHGSGL